VAQGILFASLGLNEDILYTAHQYGVISMVLNAALRCLKVSHYDTQRILYQLSDESLQWLPEIRYMALEDMNNFNPQADILASIHEKGAMRMFMN
jgi:urease accessory protein